MSEVEASAPAPLRARAYDPTTDTSVYDEPVSTEDAAPAAAPNAIMESKIQTEFVDVYLLAPEELRAIELKDFTIMKPKNNKMHRLVRYYPRCEITYTAAPPPPPPEEKVVTSPHGTTTVLTTAAPRHNGGFSNPSRNAEVFRLKRKLLNDYVASVSAEFGATGAPDDALLDNGASGFSQYHPTSYLPRSYRRPGSPSAGSSYTPAPAPKRLLPKYTRVPVGDEDAIALTSERTPALSLKARVQYIDSLWPSIAPVDDEDEIMDYYGLEVTVISEEERDASLANGGAASPDKAKTAESAASPTKTASSSATSPQKTDDDDDELPEMTVETRASALQKIKDAEMLKVSPVASKQDDWVQCDKCQKWRRLPNHVNVSELPATWYCKMNRWDKRFNKCSAPEEKIVVLMKESDLLEYRERKFALDFLQRVKRMEKALAQYKYSEARDDDGARKFVQCAECHKKRPLLGGMDPSKIAQPFVCWMNWDELRASCSAPQGALPSRDFDAMSTGAANGTNGDEPVEKSAKKSSKSAGTGNGSGNDVKHDAGAKRPSKSGSGSATGSNNSSSAKRKPAAGQTTSATAATDKTSSSSANAKKPKRR